MEDEDDFNVEDNIVAEQYMTDLEEANKEISKLQEKVRELEGIIKASSYTHSLSIYKGMADELEAKLKRAVEALIPLSKILSEYEESGYWPDNYDIKVMCKKAIEALKEIGGE